MTEQEWLTSADPREMLGPIPERENKRKLRLFACACCRQVLNPFAPRVERALSAAEAFADGEINAATLEQVRAAVARAFAGAGDAATTTGSGYLMHLSEACGSACWPGNGAEGVADAALATARAAADMPWPATGARPPEFFAELALQADLVRDIFGNPFQSVGIELEWLTETVLALARQMYESRDFGAMSILADALQDAGCDDEDILGHCRLPREHARGCWVVDLLLGKV